MNKKNKHLGMDQDELAEYFGIEEKTGIDPDLLKISGSPEQYKKDIKKFVDKVKKSKKKKLKKR